MTRPEQAKRTRNTDWSKTDETRAVIEGMVDGLNDHRIDDIGEFFADGFRWSGNTGCGVKEGLRAFQDNWQRPFQAAFSDKVCIDEARLFMGEWAAAFGRQEAVHSGEFMGVPPTGQRVEIRYMDFWHVVDGKITDNWVMVHFPHVLAQLGVDVFQGQGWERFDRGEPAPTPDARAPALEPASGWDASAEAWIAHVRSGQDTTRTHITDAPMLAAAAVAFADGGRDAVDIGCGEGRFSRMLADAGWTPIGVEPTDALRAAAEEADPGGTYLDDRAEALPLPDACADLAVHYFTLIDISDLPAAVAETVRVLRPGGRIIVATLAPWETAQPDWVPPGGSAMTPWGHAMDDYAVARDIRLTWRGIDIVNRHRPLSEVMAPFLANGLVLTSFEEPSYTGPDEKRAARFRRSPRALVMTWQKPEVSD